jgi:signal transduction histidine kinase
MTIPGDDTATIDECPAGRRRFVEVVHGPAAGRGLLGLAVVLTGLAWYLSDRAVEEATGERFEVRTMEIERAIHDRMLGHETVLWSGAGLFDASEEVTRQEWAEYIATIDLDERWPGIQGVGWSIPVDPEDLLRPEEAIRAEGSADYALRPEGERDELTAIVYLEPFDWRNQRALGYDMWSSAERRAAMRRARDTGAAATSAMITLVQETDEDVQRGFLTYVPVYEGGATPTRVEDRRAALSGWVYAPFRMNDLMDGILDSSDDTVDFEIFDGEDVTAETLLFDSNPESLIVDGGREGDRGDLHRRSTITVQGHPWTLVFEPGVGFAQGSDTLPTYVALAGMVIDGLLFLVITSLGRSNRRANDIAAEMTDELRVTNEALQERSFELERQAMQLRRSNDELRQFAHVASHDLQEPLRTMGSYSSLMASTYDDRLDEEGRRWLGYITGSAKRSSELIRQIVQFSTFGEVEDGGVPVDLNRVMVAVVDELSTEIGEASAKVLVAELPTVEGDPTQLERVLVDLVANAVAFRRPGADPRVEIGATPNPGGWRIHVRDNGVGIEPEFQQRIFDVCRRVATDGGNNGTGMGLAVCRKIIEGHGGDIGVDSTPGVGSEFWLVLPRSATSGRRPAAVAGTSTRELS